ncbi:MAG: hypothetical protein IKP66_04365 [Lachnospiraceae bacterium]|nr:hypothetical protein [Lachnospiraceae bacterium]
MMGKEGTIVGRRIDIVITSVYANPDPKSVAPIINDLTDAIALMDKDNRELEYGRTKNDNKCYVNLVIYDDRKVTLPEILRIRNVLAKAMGIFEKTGDLYNVSWTYTDRLEE